MTDEKKNGDPGETTPDQFTDVAIGYAGQSQLLSDEGGSGPFA